MSLDLKSLELFVRVAALGGIGKAGREFGLSPTAATQRIQALEAAVGVPLLHRTTRSVSLSSDGEVFLGHAQRIIADLDEALSDMQCDPAAINGELRVASSASFGRRHIAPYMAEFLERYPKLTTQLQLSDTVFDIVENGFDLAIRLGELAPSTLKARRLGVSPRIVVASPGYLERHPTPVQPPDLKDHNCLIRGDHRMWRFRSPSGQIVDARINGNFATNLAEAVTEAALTGVGVARKCKWEIAEHLDAGALIPLLNAFTVLPEWSVYAVRSPARQPPARVRVFTDFLAEKFKTIDALCDPTTP